MRADVVIVGGGVAGATAALEAAKAGYDVLLIEKRRELGRPVICGEFLPSLNSISFASRVVHELREAYKLSEEFVVHETERVLVDIEGLRRLDFELKGYVIDKEGLVRALAEAAGGMGARVLKGLRAEQVKRVKGGYVVSARGREFRASSVVGADGFPSLVARSLGMESGYTLVDWAVAGHVRARGDFDDCTVRMYVDPQMTPGGYAWVIPKGRGLANVGIGIRAVYGRKGSDLRLLLKRFLKHVGIEGVVEGPYYKCIPVGGLVRTACSGEVYLIGDSAGLVNPVNGGGIPLAMASGIAVARGLEESTYRDFLKRAEKLLNWGLTYRHLVDAFYEGLTLGKVGASATPKSLALKVLKGERTPILLLGRIARALLRMSGSSAGFP